MQDKTNVTEITGISYSAVLIWNNALNTLPPLSQEFCQTIFGSKSESNYSLGRNGINVITPPRFKQIDNRLIPQIVPVFQFGFDRMVITSPTLDGLISAYSKIENEIKKLSFQSLLSVAVMGINIEYEVGFDKGHVQKYLNQRFSAPILDENFKDGSVITELKLSLLESSKDQKVVNITIAPRLADPKKFYIKSNDHYQKVASSAFLSMEELSKYFNESIEKFERKVIPSLNLFNNGK
ncbi:hypothetical protein ACFSR6_19305 [Pedobacter vanadiisoli]|uniref:TIGR04255 family protein n=1 Tax=Pedobacter vanadiisoli TaxID=1761975 RepID=A0ABW5MN48_9SPHI